MMKSRWDMQNRRRSKYLGTSVQTKLLFLVFFSAIIPAAIVGLCMYYFIFSMMARQMMFPEAIAANLIPVLNRVNMVVLVTLPLSLLLIWVVALELSHRIAGPLYRMEKDLDDRIKGLKQGPIILRKNDELKPLAEKINKLICK